MSEDNLLIFGCYIINWISLVFVIINSSNKKQSLLIHLGIQIAYSIFWWYQLNNNSSGGAALVNWFFWIITIGIHWFVILFHLGNIFWKRTKQKNGD
jgi:hypothetical protein